MSARCLTVETMASVHEDLSRLPKLNADDVAHRYAPADPCLARICGALVAYFTMDGLPADLVEIPLEYSKRVLDWVRAHPAPDAAFIGVGAGPLTGRRRRLVIAATS